MTLRDIVESVMLLIEDACQCNYKTLNIKCNCAASSIKTALNAFPKLKNVRLETYIIFNVFNKCNTLHNL